MCGIIGVISRTGKSVDRGAFERSVARLRYRGPDAGGVHHGEGYSLGHRRLSVIDLDPRADQPMSDADGKIWITYNGEIYNFQDIREQLQGLGVRFRTSSDTEVILEAYRAWGAECLSRLSGIFAFCIVDERNGQALLARDAMGVKPLYYSDSDVAFVFASDPVTVAGFGTAAARVDVAAAMEFLSLRSNMADRSLFQGVGKLEPGQYLTVTRNGTSRYSHWTLRTNRSETAGSEDIAARIGQSIGEQLTSDVPVSMLLSGGLDSTILLKEIAERQSAPTQCYFGTVDIDDYNELPFAREAATQFGAVLNEIDITLDFDHANLVEMTRRRGHPMAMHNEYAMHQLAEGIAKRFKVVLTGEGADELFCGYPRVFRSPFDYARARFVQRLPQPLATRAGAALELDPAETPAFARYFFDRYSYFPTALKARLLKDDDYRRLEGDRTMVGQFETLFAQADSGLAFDQVNLFFIKEHLPALLGMVDSTTMAHGLEARVPFSDPALCQTAFDLAPRDKLRWTGWTGALKALVQPVRRFSEECDVSKHVLRRIYASQIPESVLRRRKMGFPLPLSRWIVSPQGHSQIDGLLSSDSPILDIFERARLRTWVEQMRNRPEDTHAKQLWQLINLNIFMQINDLPFSR